MVEYQILGNGVEYKVLFNDRIILTAKRKSKIFGDIVEFFDERGEKIIRSRHRYLFFILVGLGHKITFFQTRKTYHTNSKKSNFNLLIEEKLYSIKGEVFGESQYLLVNGEEEGCFSYRKSGLSSFEHKICCKTESACFIFSVMDIINDWFGFS